jgi:ribosomal protein S18 acetylase RimI-like enzyme
MVYDDIAAAVDVAVLAFMDDEYSDVVAPHRRANPLAYHYNSTCRLRSRFVQKRAWGFVCVSNDSLGKEEMLGYCIWAYQDTAGPGFPMADLAGNPKKDVANPPVEAHHTSLFFAVERLRCEIDDLYNSHPLSPYHVPVLDRVALSTLFSGAPARGHQAIKVEEDKDSAVSVAPPTVPTGSPWAPLPPHFHLFGLAVSPVHQRKGVGKALLQHSMDSLVNPHRVPATLVASPNGQKLYTSMGWKIVGWMGPPHPRFTGGAAMVWNGTGEQWIRDVTDEDHEKAGGRYQVWHRDADAVYLEKWTDQLKMNVPGTVEQAEKLVAEATI